MTPDSIDIQREEKPPVASQQVPSSEAWQRRFERFFASLGVVSAAFFLILLLLLGSLLLGGEGERLAFEEVISLNLVDHEGRRLGDGGFGVEMVLSPTTFYRNRPNQGDGPYRINAQGLRGGNLDPEVSRPRVLVLGGSAAFGLNVEEGNTFPALLAAAHPELEVANGGTVAYTSEQEVAQFLFELREVEPALVIDFSGWNDLYNSFWLAQNGVEINADSEANPSFLILGDRLRRMRAIEHSLAAAGQELLWTAQRRSVLLNWFSKGRQAKPAPLEFGLEEAKQVAESFAQNMDRLREITSARGAELIVVLQPEVGQTLDPRNRSMLVAKTPDFLPGDGYWHRFPELYSEFRKHAEQEMVALGIDVVDASDGLIEEGLGPRLFLDPVHLNPQGHLVIAQFLSKHLVSSGILELLEDTEQVP